MDNDNPCTVGALRYVFMSPQDDSRPGPILQVLQVKSIPSQQGAPERYRVVFSDTKNFIQSMLATQTNHLILSNQIQKGCFVRLTQYQANKVKDKKILIVLGLNVEESLGIRDKIGSPTPLEEALQKEDAGSTIPQVSAQTGANDFYGAPTAQAQRRAAPAPARQTSANASGNTQIYPIEAISPYQSKWTIKARCSYKSEKKQWSKQKSEGRLFNATFFDETGEIRVTGFNEEVDRYYDEIVEGGLYLISKCRVNMANKRWSNVENDYELVVNRDSLIERLIAEESRTDLPQMKFNFIQFAHLDQVEKDALIDVIGVIMTVDEPSQIIAKASQKPFSKRELTLVDNTNHQVRLTVWGVHADNWPHGEGTVVAFKGCKVSDYDGRSLSLSFHASIVANPDFDEAHALKGWYNGQAGRDLSTFSTHKGLSTSGKARETPAKNLQQVRDENLGMNEGTPEYFQTKATIVYVKQDAISYPGCSGDKCMKKVVEIGENKWSCESCERTLDKPEYRYVLSLNVCDAFGQAWLSAFDDAGQLVMGKTANEMQALKESSESEYADVFKAAQGTALLFRVRAKADTYQEQLRVRLQVVTASRMDWASESRKLIEHISKYEK